MGRSTRSDDVRAALGMETEAESSERVLPYAQLLETFCHTLAVPRLRNVPTQKPSLCIAGGGLVAASGR